MPPKLRIIDEDTRAMQKKWAWYEQYVLRSQGASRYIAGHNWHCVGEIVWDLIEEQFAKNEDGCLTFDDSPEWGEEVSCV